MNESNSQLAQREARRLLFKEYVLASDAAQACPHRETGDLCPCGVAVTTAVENFMQLVRASLSASASPPVQSEVPVVSVEAQTKPDDLADHVDAKKIGTRRERVRLWNSVAKNEGLSFTTSAGLPHSASFMREEIAAAGGVVHLSDQYYYSGVLTESSRLMFEAFDIVHDGDARDIADFFVRNADNAETLWNAALEAADNRHIY
ncbi:hypothetical protein [Microcella sp.]|uniref:hypothetical protein n=1 Tax=Microcella sp. TaxID=1913979 RepID=UPI003F6F8C4E